VRGRLRIDITKCRDPFILKHDVGWNFPLNNFAEESVFGHRYSVSPGSRKV
jgi:hypothetical protein